MTENKTQAPSPAATVNEAIEQNRPGSSTQKNSRNGYFDVVTDLNGRVTAAILAMILDQRQAELLGPDDDGDRFIDPWHLTLDDIERIMSVFDLNPRDLWELVRS